MWQIFPSTQADLQIPCLSYSLQVPRATKMHRSFCGGTLLQHLKELRLHVDLRKGERLFFYTTCGWMMWNWMVSTLASEASFFFTKVAVFPNAGILWQLVKDHRVAVFGLSPKYLSLCIEQKLCYPKIRPRTSTQVDTFYGSPLLAHHYDWIFNWFSGEVPISSISGGTDIVSCFLLACPLLPIYKGELQAPGLGMAVDVWDSEHAAACPQGTIPVSWYAPNLSLPCRFNS